MTPQLFGRRIQPEELPALRTVIDEHLQKAAAAVNRSFFDGEAVAHAGLMRRYALDYICGDPLLALDSEVRIGFRRKDGQSGSTWRKEFRAKLRARLGIAADVDLPTKLDTLAWVNGPLACVEVKPEAGDIVRATVQAAAHVFAFRALAAQPGTELGSVLRAVILQKQGIGLLPPTVGNPADNPAIVAVVAAPDGRSDWLEQWRRETRDLRAQLSDLLVGLRFWRLTNTGEIVEQAEA